MNKNHIDLMLGIIAKHSGFLKVTEHPPSVKFHKRQRKLACEILADLNERVNKMKDPAAYREIEEYIKEVKQ